MSEGRKNGPWLMCPCLMDLKGEWKCRITRERTEVSMDGVRVESLDFWDHDPCRMYECLLVQLYIQNTGDIVDWDDYANTGKRYRIISVVEEDSLEDK